MIFVYNIMLNKLILKHIFDFKLCKLNILKYCPQRRFIENIMLNDI